MFLSVPNVFLSRLDPLGKLPNMDGVTREVKLMLNPDTAYSIGRSYHTGDGFGVKDVRMFLEKLLRFTFVHAVWTLYFWMSG